MKTSRPQSEDAEEQKQGAFPQLLSSSNWLRLGRIETPKSVGPGNVVANHPDHIHEHQPRRNVLHEHERDLEDGERDQKDQDAKETCKGVVPAEQDNIPQLVVEHDDAQGRERDDAGGLLGHDGKQPIGDNAINEVAEEPHADKSPQRKLEAWLVQGSKPLGQLIAGEQPSNDCHHQAQGHCKEQSRDIPCGHRSVFLLKSSGSIPELRLH